MTGKKDHFRQLFQDWMEGRTDEVQEKEFIAYLGSLQDKNELYDLMKEDWVKIKTLEEPSKEIKMKVLAQVIDMNIPTRIVHRVHFLKTAWFRYAAAVLILVGISAYLFTTQKTKPIPEKIAATQDIPAPQTLRATITLANGQTINLDSVADGILASQGNVSINRSGDGRIVYTGTDNGKMIYNTINVPRGSQIASIILSDGSKIFLNAASTLKYPVAFIGKDRRIELDGEAYFDVSENKRKPFIVKTNTDSIIVLGTQFNVNAYANEPGVKTTLIEGAVKVDRQILKPGQGYLNGGVVKTDVERDVAWRRGIFQFDHSSIPEVLRQVSRWYNLDIVYQSKVPTVLFSGKLSKELSVSQIIKVLNDMQVKCGLEGGRLIVY